eukprot:TRINITY_DN56_c0_g2_i1.p1 TRINITY_DN56_c0_g2~~TRINITY_DN56_c0_g2_i1.p1  ORF type:complete len:295 (-),score=95.43 TRINITY_DN56_c0_g2_i1:988-1872(-)
MVISAFAFRLRFSSSLPLLPLSFALSLLLFLLLSPSVCQSEHLDPNVLDQLTIALTRDTDAAAQTFLQLLKKYDLNVVTAESLTSGKIASMLVDVPYYGAYVYGGHSTYDSDAKRQFLNVRVANVYSESCARQMARGALDSGRATVGLAVTGEAGPVSRVEIDEKSGKNRTFWENLGTVHSAISLRTQTKNLWSDREPDIWLDSGSYSTHVRYINVCNCSTLPSIIDENEAENITLEDSNIDWFSSSLSSSPSSLSASLSPSASASSSLSLSSSPSSLLRTNGHLITKKTMFSI